MCSVLLLVILCLLALLFFGVLLQQILIPQIASWGAMWVSGLIICYGLLKKEQLRARLAASGQVGQQLCLAWCCCIALLAVIAVNCSYLWCTLS
jgi:hypothetical protein